MTRVVPAPPGCHTGHEGWARTCQEPACRAHRARYLKRWQYERAQGLLRLGDPQAARTHIDILIGLGWSLRSIAGAAGISPATVVRIRDGQARAKNLVIAAIVQVDPDQVPSAASTQTREPFVPRIGTTRRLQALIFMGWPHAELTRRSGVNTATLHNQQGRWVTRSTHDKIVALYDQLAMTPGPSERSRGWARRLGYLGPMAWDDIDLDPAPVEVHHDYVEHTGYTPSEIRRTDIDEVAIERRLAGDHSIKLTLREKAQLVRTAIARGWSYADMKDHAGIDKPDRYLTGEDQAS